MNKISIIIITFNEAHNIRACLESVKWADEIIIVDSGSNDDTVAICKEFTHKVFVNDWPGFGAQKNKALSLASNPWVLSLDADEVVTSGLKDAIINTIQNPRQDAYYLLRRSYFLGKLIKHGNWSRDYVLRLFKKDKARFSLDPVHERLLVDGTCGKLPQLLLHYTQPTLADALSKLNRYSSLGSEKKAQHTLSFLTPFLKGLWTFLRGYFFRGGFLDGKHGLILAILNAEESYYKYLKAYLLCRK